MNLILPILVCKGYESGKGKKSMLKFLFVCLLTNFHLFLTKLWHLKHKSFNLTETGNCNTLPILWLAAKSLLIILLILLFVHHRNGYASFAMGLQGKIRFVNPPACKLMERQLCFIHFEWPGILEAVGFSFSPESADGFTVACESWKLGLK